MKFEVQQTKKLIFDSIRYGLSVSGVEGVYLLVFLLAVSVALAQYSLVAALMIPFSFISIYISFIILILSMSFKSKDEDGKVVLKYNLEPDEIKVSSANIDLKFEKSGLKWSNVFRNGIVIKHKRSTLYIALPKSSSTQIYEYMQKNGWLKNRGFSIKRILGLVALAVFYLAIILILINLEIVLPVVIEWLR